MSHIKSVNSSGLLASDDVSLDGIPESQEESESNHSGTDDNPAESLGASILNLFKHQSSREMSQSPESHEAKQQKHIETLEKARVDQDDTLAAVLSEMASMRTKHAEETAEHELEVLELKSRNASMEKRVAAMESDIDDKYALHEYAKMIQEAAPDTVDSAYVMRLKSQLARSLHKMGVLSNQLDTAKTDNKEMVKDLQNQIVESRNSAMKAEMEFMNDLFVMERECNEMKEEYEAKITSQQELIATLQIELDVEREMKGDALSYARHMKEEKKRNEYSPSVTLIDDYADELQRQMREKEEAEKRLRAELQSKMKEIETLQATCANQEQGMAKLRVDLKTLNYQKSQYAPLVKKDASQDRKMQARPKAARGA